MPACRLILKLYLSLGRMDIDIDRTRVDCQIDEIIGLAAFGDEILITLHDSFMEIRVLHEAAVDEEILQRAFLASRFRLTDEAFDRE